MAVLFDLLMEVLFWVFAVQVTKRVDTANPTRDRLLSDPSYASMAR